MPGRESSASSPGVPYRLWVGLLCFQECRSFAQANPVTMKERVPKGEIRTQRYHRLFSQIKLAHHGPKSVSEVSSGNRISGVILGTFKATWLKNGSHQPSVLIRTLVHELAHFNFLTDSPEVSAMSKPVVTITQ